MTPPYDALPGAALPGSEAHQRARKLFIGTAEETVPAAVAGCSTEDDVRAALAFALRHDLPFAVRGGGHSFAELSTSAGIVVDLSGLSDVHVREESVFVGAGVRVGDLADRLAPLGRVAPVGWCRSVGVVGAVLGGGYGVLGRYYGLGADHLLSARVLMADGRTVRAAPDEHPDLFWALRGAGGGTFGVVLSAELRTRPSVPLTAVAASWPLEAAVDVLDAWQRTAPSAGRGTNLELSLQAPDFPDEPVSVSLFGVVVDGEPDLSAFPPTEVRTTRLTAEQAAVHCDYPGEVAEHALRSLPAGQRAALRLSRAEFFAGPLDRATLTALVAHLVEDRDYGVYRDLELTPWGGALATPSDTPVAHRDAAFLVKHTVQTGTGADPARRTRAAAWADHSWSLLHPHATGTAYPNYPDPHHLADPAHYYGPHLARMREVKAAYDPSGAFTSGIPLGDIPPGGADPQSGAEPATTD